MSLKPLLYTTDGKQAAGTPLKGSDLRVAQLPVPTVTWTIPAAEVRGARAARLRREGVRRSQRCAEVAARNLHAGSVAWTIVPVSNDVRRTAHRARVFEVEAFFATQRATSPPFRLGDISDLRIRFWPKGDKVRG